MKGSLESIKNGKAYHYAQNCFQLYTGMSFRSDFCGPFCKGSTTSPQVKRLEACSSKFARKETFSRQIQAMGTNSCHCPMLWIGQRTFWFPLKIMLLSKPSWHSHFFDTKFPTLSANNGIHIFGYKEEGLFATVDRGKGDRKSSNPSLPTSLGKGLLLDTRKCRHVIDQ